MNILLKLPEDIQEKIYKIIHKDFMKLLINDIINLNWNKLKSYTEQYDYIEKKYPNMTVKYNILDDNDEYFINPDEIVLKGLCKVMIKCKNNSSIILKDPTYGDLYKCAEIKFNKKNDDYTFIYDSTSDDDEDDYLGGSERSYIKNYFSDITELYDYTEHIKKIELSLTRQPIW